MAKVGFGLIRVSTSEQNMEHQKAKLSRIAERMGYVIQEKDFFAEKRTGYDGDDEYNRPTIVALRDQITVRKPDAIFCLELSRLSRRAIKVSRYIDWLSVLPHIPMYFADYKLWTVDPNTKEPIDDNILTLYNGAKGVEVELKQIRERTSRGRDAKAEMGYYVGHLKDGYKWVLNEDGEKEIDIDEDRRPTIELIFDYYLNKQMSTAEIRNYLNAHIEEHPSPNRYRFEHKDLFLGYKNEYKDRSGNIKQRNEALWTDGMVSRILSDEWYKGVRYYHQNDRKKTVIYDDDEPKPKLTLSVKRIIDEEMWDACNKRLQQFRMRISTAKQPYLLTGLLFCGICGRKLYGHSDGGYDDMYYCSSFDYGKDNRCGLKWVRRQNIEAIIFQIVKDRAFADITYGEDTPFSKFFSIDKVQLKDINEKINTYQELIGRADQKIDELKKRIAHAVELQVKSYDNPLLSDTYQAQIATNQQDIEKERGSIAEYEYNIDKLKRQKKALASIQNKIVEVKNISDYEKAKEMLNHVISRINLYNPDRITTVIEIIYVNEKVDTVIYCPTRMLKKFIFLSKSDNDVNPYISYDKDKKKIVFPGLYYAIKNDDIIFNDTNDGEEPWDTPQNRQRVIEMFKEKGMSEAEAISAYNDAIGQHHIWRTVQDEVAYYEGQGYHVYKDEISVREYIDLVRHRSLNVYTFEDLLPMSEKGEQSKKYHQEYIKRYNKGTSFTPFIVKDATYKDIQKKRKRLYNRKDKIKRNKHLTQQQKDELIDRINEQLEAFKFQIKYLPANLKGKQNIEKYNTPTQNETTA